MFNCFSSAHTVAEHVALVATYCHTTLLMWEGLGEGAALAECMHKDLGSVQSRRGKEKGVKKMGSDPLN